MKQYILLFTLLCFISACKAKDTADVELTVGAALFDTYLPLLKGKRVALVVNQTSTIGNTHLIDTLLAQKIDIQKIFSPEHGFRGSSDAGEHVESGVDVKTNIPMISLYGNHKKPTLNDLLDIDVVIFDIQDVGVRFYTYISTMHYVMEACAEQGKKCIILDRPNPNGYYIAGPVLLPKFKSFVGMHPIPIVHGLTVGELALMINGEKWLKNGLVCDIEIVRMKGYTHASRYRLPIKPSPNLPNKRSIDLYPSLCLLEPTIMSIGRGTLFPFQVIGYPDSTFGEFSFFPIPIEGASKNPKHKNSICFGEDLQKKPEDTKFSIHWLLKYYTLYAGESFITSVDFFNKLVGNETLILQLQQRVNQNEIEKTWKNDLNKYAILRKKYLLYTDFFQQEE